MGHCFVKQSAAQHRSLENSGSDGGKEAEESVPVAEVVQSKKPRNYKIMRNVQARIASTRAVRDANLDTEEN